MKRILIALAMVAMLVAPALAQQLDVTVSGELIGSYNDQESTFNRFSWIDRDYSNLALQADLGKVGLTYRAGLDDLVGWRTPYTREAYLSIYDVAALIDEIKVGEFTFPFAAGQWIGYHGGLMHISSTAVGVEVSGSISRLDYRLAMTNSENSQWMPAFAGSGEKPLWAKISGQIGNVDAGLSYVGEDFLSAWGLDAAFGLGPVDMTAEYVIVQESGYDDFQLGFLGAGVPIGGPLSLFGKYYWGSGGSSSYSALAYGVDYAMSANATLRLQHMIDKDNLWLEDLLEGQLRFSF